MSDLNQTPVQEGDFLWRPSAQTLQTANLTRFMAWLKEKKAKDFDSYQGLWEWSVSDLAGFWEAVWEYFGVQASTPYESVLSPAKMPGAGWFPGARLNFAQHIFARMTDERPAFMFKCEDSPMGEMSWRELRSQVASVAANLKEIGVEPGDRVVAYMPNIPETLIAFLACASLGAVWSSCSPDFAARSVLDRFGQIQPKVLFASDGYVYGGKTFDTSGAVADLAAKLPELLKVVVVPCAGHAPKSRTPGALTWNDLLGRDEPLEFAQVPFEHPMWVVYSSGTTGMPKGLVHSQGGILLEMYKFLSFHLDLKPSDTFFWFSTTGWVMWNIVISGLLTGAVPILYDGNPAYPEMDSLWRMARDAEITVFGTSAAFITACMKQGMSPKEKFDLSKIRAVGSTGSPLPPEGFKWVYDHIGDDLDLGSTSGGTDICSGFMAACPLMPVRAGQLQCRALGVNAQAWDEEGNPLIGEVGELVITDPMPSMPIYLWKDPDGSRYLESYFDTYPGVWRHGDWMKVTEEGGCVILGRSDATLNRQGVRMGSSDFYRVVEDMPEVADSLIVGYTTSDGNYHMPLFVVPAQGVVFDQDLQNKIKSTLRNTLTPRHVPDQVIAVSQVPRTINGKKLEVPVIKILSGKDPEKAVNRDSMANPESLDFFINMQKESV